MDHKNCHNEWLFYQDESVMPNRYSLVIESDVEIDIATFYIKTKADFTIHFPENVEVGNSVGNIEDYNIIDPWAEE